MKVEWRNGRIDRKFQHWDTPFFIDDGLKNGKCTSGDIVTEKITP